MVPVGDDDDDGKGVFDVWKCLSPLLNINKQSLLLPTLAEEK